LRILRGSGPDGMGGIAERSADGTVVRPLLAVPRSDIERYARGLGLAWREDASNLDPAFARNRLRHHWLPGLAAAFQPRLLQRIADLAEAQRRDAEWIAGEVASAANRLVRRDGDAVWLERRGWDAVPEALARRVARHALQLAGGGREVSRTHLERMLGRLRRPRSGTVLELPGSLVMRCDPDGYRLGRRESSRQSAC
jgi:tRNA(Ile)-lysidine synthase